MCFTCHPDLSSSSQVEVRETCRVQWINLRTMGVGRHPTTLLKGDETEWGGRREERTGRVGQISPMLYYIYSKLLNNSIRCIQISFLHITFSILYSVKFFYLLTNTAPFSMSGTTMGMKPCRSRKETFLYVYRILICSYFANFLYISRNELTRRCSVSRAKFWSAVWSLAPVPLR